MCDQSVLAVLQQCLWFFERYPMFHSLPSLTPEALFGDGYSSDRTKEWSWDPFFTASPWSIQLGWGMIFLWDYYGNSYGISLCFLCYFHVISMIFYDQSLQTWRSIKVSSSKATCYRLDGPDAQASQLLFLLCWIVFIDPLLDFCFRFGEEIGYMQQLVGFYLLCPT